MKPLPDPRCRGKAWVGPITALDLWRRYYQLGLLASSGVFIGDIVATQPPGATAARAAPAVSPADATSFWRELKDQPIGSNAVGLGSESTESGRGMLLANPHFPWIGGERFYQFQLTLAGQARGAGRQPARHPGGEYRLQRPGGLVAHGLHGVAIHAVPAPARGRRPEGVRVRRQDPPMTAAP